MTSDSGFTDADDDDSALLGGHRGRNRRRSARHRPRAAPGDSGTWLPDTDLPALLGPLCAATEALARLDARAAAAPAPVRAGLIARMEGLAWTQA
jgi:hypothetical protein